MDETNEVKIKKAIDHLADQIVKLEGLDAARIALDYSRAIEHLANAIKTIH